MNPAAALMRRALLSLSQSDRTERLLTRNRLAWRAASRFIAGQTVAEAIAAVRALNAQGMAASLDYLGENVATLAEARASADAYVEAVRAIRQAGVHSGISLKLTALGLDLGDAVAEAELRRILGAAAGYDPPVFVRIDMEGSAYTERTLALFHRVRADYERVGVVVQAYLYRTAADVAALVAAGSGPRLCKGAYLEDEDVAWPAKADVDASYRRLAEALLGPEARAAGVYAAMATHDPAMIDHIKAFTAGAGMGRDSFEFQMLYGIRRDLQDSLVAEGYRMRVYVPYGSAWYPYFMRRLAERPENLAFIVRNVARERRR